VERTVNGATFRVDSRTRLSFPPAYDRGVTQLLRSALRPGDEAWNIGANVGVHVLQMCALVGPAGRVVAFEPNPQAAALLRRNVALNGYSERVAIIEAVVGEHAGTTQLFVAGADPMARAGKPNPLLPATHAIQVPVLTLDDFLAQNGRAPDCMVMDIEGWEVGALMSGRQLLRLAACSIVELHPDSWEWSRHSRRQLEVLMAGLGMEAVPLSGQTDPLAEHGQVWLQRVEPGTR
jgi:FkbM family methyltransferase